MAGQDFEKVWIHKTQVGEEVLLRQIDRVHKPWQFKELNTLSMPTNLRNAKELTHLQAP
jgi:hypothetical protein